MFDDMLKVGEGVLIVGGAFKVIAGLASAIMVVKGGKRSTRVRWRSVRRAAAEIVNEKSWPRPNHRVDRTHARRFAMMEAFG